MNALQQVFHKLSVYTSSPEYQHAQEVVSQKEIDTQRIQSKKEADELLAWQKTPAGMLCVKHPTWQKDECEGLIAKKVWVGMSYEMLVFLRGVPDHKNVSNYGDTNKYQYCWSGRTPSCFYDDNDDGIMDAFN